MASNTSTDDIMKLLAGRSAKPAITPQTGGFTTEDLMAQLYPTDVSEGEPKGVDAGYGELAFQGALRGIEKVGAGVQELGRSAFTEVTGIDVLSDWKNNRQELEKDISGYVDKMNGYEKAAFGGAYNVAETGSVVAALPATTAKAVLTTSGIMGAALSTSDGELLSQERTMNMLVAMNSGLLPAPLLNAGKYLVGKAVVDPLSKVFKGFTKKGGEKTAMEGVKTVEVQEAVDAADRLGVRITPAEASANQAILKRESGAMGGLNPEKALVAQEIKTQRDTELASVVGDFVENIVPEGSKAASATLNGLYKTAFDVKMSPRFLVKLRENNIFASAEKRLMGDPAKAAKFMALREGSLGQVELIRREISNNAHSATKSIDAVERAKAGALLSVNSLIKGALKKSSPEYELALPIAQRVIAKKRILTDLSKVKTKASPTGTSIYEATPDQFYDTILATPEKRGELVRQLKNVGGSGQAVEDLAFILARLKKSPFTALNAADQGAMAQSGTFGIGKVGIAIGNTLAYTKGRHNQAMLDIITNGKWHNSLRKIKVIKDPTKQREALATALAYITSSNVAENSKEKERTAAR